MVKAPEVRRLPRQIDVIKLCQQGQSLEGLLDLSDLPRLAEALSAPSGALKSLQPTLRFDVDAEGHRVMTGHFNVQLPLICQRCLDVMEFPIKADFQCAFVATDEKAKHLPAHLEPVVLEADSPLVELYDLLEDELILNLPISALHERCAEEVLPGQSGQNEGSEKPFAALAQLLSSSSLKKES